MTSHVFSAVTLRAERRQAGGSADPGLQTVGDSANVEVWRCRATAAAKAPWSVTSGSPGTWARAACRVLGVGRVGRPGLDALSREPAGRSYALAAPSGHTMSTGTPAARAARTTSAVPPPFGLGGWPSYTATSRSARSRSTRFAAS